MVDMFRRRYRRTRSGGTMAVMFSFILSLILFFEAGLSARMTGGGGGGKLLNSGNGHDLVEKPERSRVWRRDTAEWIHRGLRQVESPTQDSEVSPSTSLNCTPSSLENFPPLVLGLDVLEHGGFLINLAAVCYLFVVLAVVCDNYFMPSLEIICADLHLSEDVAGASFMAIGGSAPELFTAIFGVFIAKGNIGVGTVIGSAVFNILCVIGLCGLLAGQVVYLSKWPLARDSMCYTITVLALVLVILDKEINWWESTALIVLYIAYLVFLYFDPSIRKRVERFSMCVTSHGDTNGIIASTSTSENDESTPIYVEQKWKTSSFTADDDNANNEQADESDAASPDEVNTLSPFVYPDGSCKRLFWWINFPCCVLFYLTIPNCSLARWRRWYPVTFVVSLMWIGGLTYILVWMVTIIGYVLYIPDTVMGLTLLAAGSSTPDTILSIIAARNGNGDMAVSHSIGSNIFDILMGLGLPWFLHSTVVYRGHPVPTNSDGLTIIAGMLLITVVVALITIKLGAFKLNKKIGVVFLIFYLIFLVPAILLELNVLIDGLVLPPCSTKHL